jgi:ABC-type Fe3+-hydroxamate transport system substrate-binding protein
VRIVSLVPSATETLIDWGITPIAVTRFCERPELPAVGGTKDPNVEAIAALAPDLVVLCEEENRIEDADRLAAVGLALHTITVRSVGDVPRELDRLAETVGAEPSDATLPDPSEPTGIRAFVPIWRRPWMTLNDDTYGSSVLRHLGITNIFGAHPERYPTVTLEDAAAQEPDRVIAPSEPYPFRERHRAELEAVAPVMLVDGQDLFWWGSRTPLALERLRAGFAG